MNRSFHTQKGVLVYCVALLCFEAYPISINVQALRRWFWTCWSSLSKFTKTLKVQRRELSMESSALERFQSSPDLISWSLNSDFKFNARSKVLIDWLAAYQKLTGGLSATYRWLTCDLLATLWLIGSCLLEFFCCPQSRLSFSPSPRLSEKPNEWSSNQWSSNQWSSNEIILVWEWSLRRIVAQKVQIFNLVFPFHLEPSEWPRIVRRDARDHMHPYIRPLWTRVQLFCSQCAVVSRPPIDDQCTSRPLCVRKGQKRKVQTRKIEKEKHRNNVNRLQPFSLCIVLAALWSAWRVLRTAH